MGSFLRCVYYPFNHEVMRPNKLNLTLYTSESLPVHIRVFIYVKRFSTFGWTGRSEEDLRWFS